jgi:hypothetical protein
VDDPCAFCNRADVPAPIQAAIAHAQFETIHPFFDGNGRVGRALILIVLRRRGLAENFAANLAALQRRWMDQAGNPRTGSGPRRLIELLPSHPMIDVKTATELLGGSAVRARQAMARLEAPGVIRQTSVRKRDRAWESIGLFDLLYRFERDLGPSGRTPKPTR